MASQRTETPAERTGSGITDALHRVYSTSPGEAIANVYPPDSTCDAQLDSLIDQLRQVPLKPGTTAITSSRKQRKRR